MSDINNLSKALQEYHNIIIGLREEYSKNRLTIKALRNDHKEFDVFEDEFLQDIINQVNKERITLKEAKNAYIDLKKKAEKYMTEVSNPMNCIRQLDHLQLLREWESKYLESDNPQIRDYGYKIQDVANRVKTYLMRKMDRI